MLLFGLESAMVVAVLLVVVVLVEVAFGVAELVAAVLVFLF